MLNYLGKLNFGKNKILIAIIMRHYIFFLKRQSTLLKIQIYKGSNTVGYICSQQNVFRGTQLEFV